MKKLRVLLILPIIAIMLIPAANAVDYVSASNRYAFSNRITAGERVDGDFVAFGETVKLQAGVGGDIITAGRTVQITDSGNVQNVFTAGQFVEVQVNAAKNVYAAGYNVNVDASSLIGAYLTGNNITFRGSAEDVHAAGASVLIDGNISGNLVIYSSNITFSDRAGVGGTIDIYGSHMPDLPSSIDKSKVTFHPVKAENVPKVEARNLIIPKIVVLLAAAILALFVALLAGRFIGTRAAEFKRQVGWMILWGLISCIVIPVASIICMITVIGIPLGMIALLLLGIVLYLAPVLTGAVLGRLLLPRLHPILSFMIGAVVIKLLTFIPYFGALLYLACAFYALGSIVNSLKPRKKSPAVIPEPPAENGPSLPL